MHFYLMRVYNFCFEGDSVKNSAIISLRCQVSLSHRHSKSFIYRRKKKVLSKNFLEHLLMLLL